MDLAEARPLSSVNEWLGDYLDLSQTDGLKRGVIRWVHCRSVI